MAAGSVHVVIVNWNAGHLLNDCLQSFSAVAADTVRLESITHVVVAAERDPSYQIRERREGTDRRVGTTSARPSGPR
jgi:hypothetical protein